MWASSALKFLGALGIATVLLHLIVANFSAIESRYECEGQIASSSVPEPLKIYVKLQEYRWWVDLWSDSDGSMFIEVPNQSLEYVSHIKRVGDQLQLFESRSPGTLSLKGNFSTLSQAMAIRVIDVGFFDGTCSIVKGQGQCNAAEYFGSEQGEDHAFPRFKSAAPNPF